VATNEPIVHPQVIYEHAKPWWNDINRRKLLLDSSTRALAILPAKSSSSKAGGTGRNDKIVLKNLSSFILLRDF
jgi:hypothetical protein